MSVACISLGTGLLFLFLEVSTYLLVGKK